jgi:PAS domain S-box-containing protein
MSPRKAKSIAEAASVKENGFHLLFRNHPLPMWIYDLETLAFLEVNEAALEKYGYAREEFLGMTIKDIRPAEDVPRLMENLGKIRTALQHSGVWRHRLRDGRVIDVEINSHLIEFNERKCALVAARDVTEQKQVEYALQESEALYRDLVENSQQLICTHDLKGNILSVNEAAVRLTGYSRSDLLRMNLKNALTPQGRKGFDAYIARIKKHGRASGVMHVRIANGETRIWEYNNTLRTEGVEKPVVRGMARDITEQKRAEDALQASEKRFRALIEHGLDNISLLSAVGKLLWESPSVNVTLGYTPNQYIGYNLFELMHPDDLEWTRRLYEQLLREPGGSQRGVFRLRSSSGEWRWVEAIATNMLDEPHIEAIVINYRDITERKRMEEELQKSERRYRSIAEDMPAMVCRFKPDGTLTFINSFYCEYFGKPREELLGSNLFSLIPAPEAELVREKYLSLDREQPFITYEYKTTKPDGGECWQRWTDRALFNERDEIVEYQSIGEDVTEQKRADDARDESEKRYRGLFENSPISLWEEDFSAVKLKLDGLKQAGVTDFEAYFSGHPEFVKECAALVRVLNVNAASLKLYGVADKEELMKNLDVILHAEDLARQFRHELVNIANGVTYFEGEGRDRSWDGRLLHTALTWSVMPGHEEDLSRVIVSVADITERKQAEEERRRLIRELSERVKELTFLHNISRIFMDSTRSESDVLQEVANNMPHAWQYPEAAAARIGYNGKQFTSPNYRETDWMQSHFFDLPNGDLGFVQVAYLEERPAADEGPFLKEERRLVELTAEKLQTYLRGMLADRAIKAHNEELALLLEAGKELNGTFDLQEIYEIVYRYMLQSLPCDHLCVFSHDTNAHLLHCEYSRDAEGKHDVSQIPPLAIAAKSRDPLSIVLETGTALILSGDVEGLYAASPNASGAHSAILVPLVTRGQVSGVMQALHSDLNAYAKSHLHFMESLAFRISAAMSNAKLFNELQAELIERRLIEEEIRQLNAELEKRVQDRTAQIEAVKRRFELAAHAGQIGVWEYNPRENKVVWDERMHILHHLPLGTFDGTVESWSRLIHPDDLERSNLGGQMALTENLLLNNEHRIVLPDGSIRHLATSAVTVFSESGTPDRVIGISTDVTERKKAEEALRIANQEMENALRVKDEFLANMSHELRTPLNAILGISESLEEQFIGALNEKQLKYVQVIRESGRHLLELINDILDISKIEAGRMELDFRPISVEKLCQSSLRMVKELAQKNSLNVSFNVRGNVKIVRGDERRLKQLLVNLLSNAVKFTEKGKRIGLTVEGIPEANEIVFFVWDEGIGISKENLPRLFKPFVQLDAGLTKEYHGTGLGLALVAQIARLHGGRVSVESGEGRGSRFIVTLPWLPHDQQAEAKVTGELRPPPAPRSERRRSGRILLIEDTDTTVALMQEYLIHLGYEVSVARNGVEGVIAAKKEHPDLILMDVMMPVMDGLEAAKVIRTDKDLMHIPIIALTALAMPGDRERCLAAGMNDYLSKPIRMNDLTETIEKHLVAADAK